RGLPRPVSGVGSRPNRDPAIPRSGGVLSRVAEELFWMARYVERGLTVARLSEVTWHLELDAGDEAGRLWIPLLAFGSEPRETHGRGGPNPSPREIRRYLAFDAEND